MAENTDVTSVLLQQDFDVYHEQFTKPASSEGNLTSSGEKDLNLYKHLLINSIDITKNKGLRNGMKWKGFGHNFFYIYYDVRKIKFRV